MPGLKLTIPILTNGNLLTTVFESDTNSAYDIFRRQILHTNAPWFRAASGEIGQTNFTLPIPPTNSAFFIAAEYEDSDFDGLPDAYEQLVLHTNPLSADSDNDGIPDGLEDANQNGIPDFADYSALTRAVIYTVDSTACEGGCGGGEFNILLPSPAPTNGTTILLNLGGTAGYESDYLLSTSFGYITNEVVFLAGEYWKRIFVTAVDDAVQQTRPRTVQVALLSSANYALDPTPANVSLVDNDLPVVAIFAQDPIAGEHTNAMGVITNSGAFHFRRYGDTTQPLNLWFSVSGTAQNGVDYPGSGPVITIAAGSDRVTLELTPIQDNVYEGDEDIILTLTPSPFQVQEYTIHPLHTSARVVIKDDELPAVSITAVDGTAAEYGSDTGLIRFQRTGSLAQPLAVDLAIAGSAKNGVDYAAISNFVTFPVNVSQIDLPIQPLTDSVEETVETVIVTMRGSANFNFSGTNAATVLIDDNSNTRFVVTRRKPTSVYCPFPAIESPAVFDMERRGRSAGSTNLPFLIYTNTGSGLETTTYYRATGDVSGQNIAFAPFATRARVNFTIPESRRLMPEVSVFLQVPSLTNTTHEIRYLPEWRFVRLEILSTNAIEGTSTNARLRLSRLVADAAVSATFTLGGAARGPGDPQTVDYNFTSPFTMTIPAQSLSVETSIAGLADGYLEGWESIFVTPDFTATDVSLDFQPPAVLFIREDTADPGSLPGSDFDLDGMPDYWEVANALDPFAPGDEEWDADGDGLTNIEEYRFGTNPRAADTDANGVNDFRQHVLAADPGPDYVPVRLYTKDTGKVNNGMNCAVCHTTQLKVGDYSLYSMRSANQEAAEKTYWYRKGQSYPIFLREIVATLPPTTNTSGNPTTTALYTAGILPATNAPQAFVVQDPANKLGTNQPWSNFPSNTLTQVGTLVVPKIQVSWESYPNNVPLDANTNNGGGLRVFPDRLNPTDESSREFVLIRVKTIPPVPGQPVRLKAFDVDDPTEHPDDVSGVIDSNDSGGVAMGEDNLGIPKFGQLLTDQITLDNAGEATVPFRVALKPGDNYRIAVLLDTPGASNYLGQLQVNNPSAPFYVASGTNEVAGFIGGISPMLTVWRKLHLEFDSMAAPPANGPEALYDPVRIWRVTPNYPSLGRSTLGLTLSNVADGLNLYEYGKIEIPGVSTNRVLKSNSRLYVGGSHTVIGAEIAGVIPTNAIGLTARLYDDDDRFLNDDPLYRSDLRLQSPPLPADARSGEFVQAMQSSFAQTYIQAVDANAMGWNPPNMRTVPFKRHADLGVASSPFDGNLQLRGTDKPEFWAYSVVLAYQDDPSEDGDPDREEPNLGINADDDATTTLDGFCVVFLECVRDKVWGLNNPDSSFDETDFLNQLAPSRQSTYLNRLYGAIIHEVCHAPPQQNLLMFDHSEGGLMQKGGSDISTDRFFPRSILRLRSASKWTP